MNFTIRRATLKDLKEVQNLCQKLFEKEIKEYDSTLNFAWTFSKIGTKYVHDRLTKKSGCVFVAEHNKKIVGYLSGRSYKSPKHRTLFAIADLENIYVLEKYRSKGVGLKLHAEFLKWCKLKKAEKIKVHVYTKNLRAIKFYKKQGFKDYSTILESDLR